MRKINAENNRDGMAVYPGADRLLHLLGMVSDSLLEEMLDTDNAEKYNALVRRDEILEKNQTEPHRGKYSWKESRWYGPLKAACICVVLIASPAILLFFGYGRTDSTTGWMPGTELSGNSSSSGFHPGASAAVVSYDGTLYMCVLDSEWLTANRLPADADAGLAGERLTYLTMGGEYDYVETEDITDKALYRCQDREDVWLLKDGEEWFFVKVIDE